MPGPVKIPNKPVIYKPTPPNYFESTYNQCADLVKRCYKQAYGKIPTRNAIAQSALRQLNASKDFVWRHRKVLLGGIVVAAAIAVFEYIRRTTADKPFIEMRSSLNHATLSISIPVKERKPPHVALTFCVDESNSMDNEKRLETVKSAVKKVLENAQKIVSIVPGAHIEIAIIGFDVQAKIISSPVKLDPHNSKIMEDVTQQFEDSKMGGGTDILKGLEMAIATAEKMMKSDSSPTHTIILLSDGEDTRIDALAGIHKRITQAGAKLFAIGIGAGHSKAVMQEIAGSKNKGFKGTYIDTSADVNLIDTAVSNIYSQAIASFHDLELSSTQLAAGAWSVNRVPSISQESASTCRLGVISEGADFRHFIEIHKDKVAIPLELSTVSFTLTYKDPRGRKGRLTLPWNPTTSIDPEIVRGS